MAKAKKLPSGSWRVRVYSHTGPDGVKHYESFTADTKKDAELAAAQFAAAKDKKSRPQNMTVDEAIDRYITLKEGVLSPTTVRTYRSCQRTHCEAIKHISIRDITNADLQAWVSDLAKKLSPKTIRNSYGLIVAVIDMFNPDMRIKVQLPQKKQTDFYTPSDEDVKHLLEQVRGTELELAIYLAAFGTLRRGEICALTDKDVHDGYITVNKDTVRDINNNWVVKPPKTDTSNRNVPLPAFVMQRLQGIEGNIVKMHPDALTEAFRRAVRRSGGPVFRLHDLRHYSASILHAIGVPDQYIMARGGWATDNVMKTVYRNTIDEETARQNKKILDHFKQFEE